ncbi:MAG: hypothetical protein HWN67_17590 [Candidatus Helarchaeota archaeon]|nr:hypothetical protein [Candidatus Helarchaeota archaeon]
MNLKFFIIILFITFLFSWELNYSQEVELYEKYSSDFGEINQEIFQKPLWNILSYNIDMVINVQEESFSAESLINLLITNKDIQDTFYFCLGRNVSVKEIEFDGNVIEKWEIENDSERSDKSLIYKFYFPFSELKMENMREIKVKINYIGKIESNEKGEDFLEFGANFNWYPFVNSRTSFRYLLNIGIDRKYSIVSPANIIRKIRKDKKEYYTLQLNKPASQIVFLALKGMKKKEKRYRDGTYISIYYKKLPSIEVTRTFIEIEWILGFYFDRFVKVKKEKKITAVFLPRAGRFYAYYPSFFMFPEKEIKGELNGWEEYRIVFQQMCNKIAHFWWENCTPHWLEDGLCGYFSIYAVETMYGYDEVMRYMNIYEKNVINFEKELSANSKDLNFLDKEIIFKQKVPFVLRMLSFYIGIVKFNGVIKELAEYSISNSFDKDYFRTTAEKYYGSTLRWFFNQWFESSDIPRIMFDYKIEAMRDGGYKILFNVEQFCKRNFILGIMFIINFEKSFEYRKIMLSKKQMKFTLIYMDRPVSVVFDKDNYILDK